MMPRERLYVAAEENFDSAGDGGAHIAAYRDLTRWNTFSELGITPAGDVQTTELSDGTRIAVFVADDGSKADADRTSLYYAVYDAAGNVEKFEAVCETGRGDYSPRLVTAGNNTYVAWLNSRNSYGDTVTYSQLAADLQICVAEYDEVDRMFLAPTVLESTTGQAPLKLQLASDGRNVSVIWMENTSNDVMKQSGTSSIYARTITDGAQSKPQTIASGPNYIYDMDAAYIDGGLSVAYTADTDRDVQTYEDIALFLVRNGERTKLTNTAEDPKDVVFSGNRLYYTSEGYIREIKDLAAGTTAGTGIACDGSFRVLNGDRGRALLVMKKDETRTVPMVSYEKDGAFTAPVVLNDFGNVNITYYSAEYRSDGTIDLLMISTTVKDNWNGEDSLVRIGLRCSM